MKNELNTQLDLRKSITELDVQLLGLLADRRSISRKVAQCKRKTNSAIRDEKYEDILLSERIKAGKALGLGPHYVAAIYHTILSDSALVQHEEMQAATDPKPDQPGRAESHNFDGDRGKETAPALALNGKRSKPKSNKSGKAIAEVSYKLASRGHRAANSRITVGGVEIGGKDFITIAGPCAVESRDQLFACARNVQENGGHILRGGCFKPRTSPYSFQGLGFEGLDLLIEAGRRYGLPIITEVLSQDDVGALARGADILQIGSRNMQNFSLLKAVGRVQRPVMLKRGLMASLDELLNAAEYILAEGNSQVMLCERGIRTFETATRNTLDLSAVPILRERTHLPIIIDPSHAVGRRDLVAPLARAAKAVGADGIMVEIHPRPEEALSDGPQALRFPQFAELMSDLYAPT